MASLNALDAPSHSIKETNDKRPMSNLKCQIVLSPFPPSPFSLSPLLDRPGNHTLQVIRFWDSDQDRMIACLHSLFHQLQPAARILSSFGKGVQEHLFRHVI